MGDLGVLSTTAANAGLALSLVEAKAQLRVEHSLDDPEIEALIGAAQTHLENHCQITLMPSTLEISYSGFQSELKLRHGVVRSVDLVSYTDADGVVQDLPGTAWQWQRRGEVAAVVAPAPGGSWPSTQAGAFDAVRVTYDVGWEQLPLPLVHALKFLLSHFYENRSLVGTVASARFVVPLTFEALVGPYCDRQNG